MKVARRSDALLGLLLVFVAFCAQARGWHFAVIGDTPYSARERRELPAMLEAIAGSRDAYGQAPAFVVHVGDFKHSRQRCSDALFRDRYRLFDASRIPFIYVPGDNEWTDCALLLAGHYDPLERLARLRELFFATPYSLGQTRIALEQQPGAYREHLRWWRDGILFVTLNVPGPDNNYGNGPAGSAEFVERNRALLDWVDAGFDLARREHAAAVVIVMQGDPEFRHHAAGLAHAGYRQLLDAFYRQTRDFSGQVLLVHGDTHWQRVDHPLRQGRDQPSNFTRLESFGYPFMGWVDVSVDRSTPRLFGFTAHPLPLPLLP